jgi:hypothetical protein
MPPVETLLALPPLVCGGDGGGRAAEDGGRAAGKDRSGTAPARHRWSRVVAHRGGAGRCCGGDGWGELRARTSWGRRRRVVVASMAAHRGGAGRRAGRMDRRQRGVGGSRDPPALGRVAALRKCFRVTPSPAGLRPLFRMRWAVHS